MKTVKKLFKLVFPIILSLCLFVLLIQDPFEIIKKVNAEGETEIYYLQDLYDVRNDLTGSYLLMNNLDFDSDSSYDQTDPDWATKKTTWTTGDGWTPIGGYYTPFTGTLDGQDYTISNLLIDTPTDIYDVALFGSNDGTIQNIGLLDVNITGHDNPSPTPGEFTGALVGYNRGTIDNCYSTGAISTNANFAGGLVGYSDSGTITYSYSEATVTYTGADYDTGYGGLVGNNYGDALIDHCYATGLVSELNSEHTGIAAGGLVGDNESGTITNSYATGNVQGFYESVGGLSGEVTYGDILNSYATGSVEGLYDSIGGLVGYVYTSNISNSFATGSVEGDDALGGLLGKVGSTSTGSFINDCYATGDVTENDYSEDGYEIGGLIGYAIGYTRLDNSYSTGYITSVGTYADDVGGLIGSTNSPYITNSFWDIETSGRTESPRGTGKTTAEMRSISTFNDTATNGLDTAWDIVLMSVFDPEGSNIWYIDDGNDYPRLFLEYEEPSIIVVETDPTISTNTAINITTSSSQIRGSITDLGSYESVNAYFQYKKTSGSVWIDTTPVTKTAITEVTYSLTNLDPNSQYDFRFAVGYGSDETIYGEVKSFTTTKVTLPKVVITDIGLIDDVLDLDDMLYYFTSETVHIQGTSYKNTHVKFVTNNEDFETDADSNGDFDITFELPRGTNEIEYYAYNDFGSQSATRTLTLVIGEENFPSNDDTEEEDINEEEDIVEEENDETINNEEEQEETEIQIITFTDEDGNPLSGAEIEIDGKTYTTNENGEIEVDILSEGIHTARITYNGETYTKDILATKSAHIEIVVEVQEKATNWKTIIIISSAVLLFIILLIIFFKRKREEEQNTSYTN
ncbi:MAG: GLUG motif-containing protein [Candidatus Dojkabacteria bacterium]|nr:GLUG motif-containing protein [Candidatus Dojkabacteria bacterium]